MSQLSRQARLENELVDLLPAIRAFARRFERDPTDAEDLVQEAVSKALANLDKFHEGTSLKSWLFTITKNAFCTRYQSRKRLKVGDDDCVSQRPSVNAPQEWAVRMDEFQRAFNALPSRYREAMDVVLLQGQSYEAASETCRCPVGTVKSRISRGRKMLAERLD
jgi:RNA polymerase sigma-70 factor (ECF subfamily)